MFARVCLLLASLSCVTTTSTTFGISPTAPATQLATTSNLSPGRPVIFVGNRTVDGANVICFISGFSNTTCQTVPLESGSFFTSISCGNTSFVAGIQSVKPFRNGFASGWFPASTKITTGLEAPVDSVSSSGSTFLLGGRFRTSLSILKSADANLYSVVNTQIKPPCVLATAWSNSGIYAGGCFTQPFPGILRIKGGPESAGSSSFSPSLQNIGGVMLKGSVGTVYAITAVSNQIFIGGAFDTVGATNLSTNALVIFNEDSSSWSLSGAKIFPGGVVKAIATSSTFQMVVIGGSFCSKSGCNLLRSSLPLNGKWTTLGAGIDGSVSSIAFAGSAGIFVIGSFRTLDVNSPFSDAVFYSRKVNVTGFVPSAMNVGGQQINIRGVSACQCGAGLAPSGGFSCASAQTSTAATATQPQSASSSFNTTSTSTTASPTATAASMTSRGSTSVPST